MKLSAASPFRPLGALPAAPLATYAGPWSGRHAAHLLRRAGFGGSVADVSRLAASPMNAAVDSLVHFADTSRLPPPPDFAESAAMGGSTLLAMAPERRVRPAAMSVEERKALRAELRRQDIANVTWWLERMVATPAPLQEKMTLYLHGHFATASNQKGIYGRDIVVQNELLRRYALGNWQELTHAVARDRAMLKWLDNARSEKAHPNENFARELMELFTLGIGNYSERDVRESARAFTGYTFVRRTGEFAFVAERHDDGQKTFLGRTGAFNGDDIIDILYAQPATATYYAHRVLEFFLYSDPEPQLVEAFASLIATHRFEMLPVMSTLFRSNVFYSDRAYRALVKSPVEFVVGAYRLFGVTDVKPEVLGVLRRMGQVPFHPPSVKGWDGGAQWLNTQSVLARENFASALMATPNALQTRAIFGDGLPPAASDAAKQLVGAILQGDASPAAVESLRGYLDGRETSAIGTLSPENADERLRGAAYLTMALPAFQLS